MKCGKCGGKLTSKDIELIKGNQTLYRCTCGALTEKTVRIIDDKRKTPPVYDDIEFNNDC